MARGRGGIIGRGLLSYARPRTVDESLTDPTFNGDMPRGKGGITRRVGFSYALHGTRNKILDDSTSNDDMSRGRGRNTRKGGLSYAPQGTRDKIISDSTYNGNGNETSRENVVVTNSGSRSAIESSWNLSLTDCRKQLSVVNGFNNPNPNSFDDSQNLSDSSPQPQYETYPCELCGNDSHYGYDCPPRFSLVYEQEPCYNQNYNENYYPHNLPRFLCCNNCEGPHESFQCQSMNQNFFEPTPCYEPNSFSFDQYQHLQSFVTQQLPQRSNEDIRLEMAKLIKNNRILLNNNIFPHEEASMEVLLAKERILKLIQAWDEKQTELWSLPKLLPQLLNDSRTIDKMLKQREHAANLAVQQEQEEQAAQIFTPYWNFSMINDDEEHSIQYKEYLENSSNAITTVLPTEEPEYSLSMGYKHLSTIPETELDEVIKSSVKNLVQIPSEYEVTFDDESECDVPVKDESSLIFTTFSNPLFDCNNDFTSSDDVSLSNENVPMENFKVYSNSLFDDEEINSDKIDPHYFNTESDLIESLSNRDTLFDSSPKFDYLEEFSGELMPTSIINEERIKRECEEYISLMEKLLAINSFPRPLENFHANTINETLPTSTIPIEDSDSLREEIDIFTDMDDLMPPRIKSDDYDSERDIHFLEELLGNDSISIPKNESSNFDHNDDPSFPRPPPEPPDVKFFFDFEPNSGELISAVMNNIDELNKDECFDPGGGEIDVFANFKDDDYFPFIFVIRIFLPYLIYPKVSPLLLSAGSEDTIFYPGIST
uniref:Reverse transcriptase domain-containing protein n=1 Tax=Tanacetum cinerariifolium TaxID=118510 RepID=A0A6L2KRI9_TANCI|nr:hypothetical protein [Tanacetum cinerariifolium]